jgi:peptide deformylase
MEKRKKMVSLGLSMMFILCICATSCRVSQGFTSDEEGVIGETGQGIMPLRKITDKSDSLFLRKEASLLGKAELESQTFKVLKERMLATVKDTLDEGVGIAAPQVGISRRVVAVQRFDKEGEPFEFYVNPVIVSFSESTVLGKEGCLSVPDVVGTVRRSKQIELSYDDLDSYTSTDGDIRITDEKVKRRTETVKGYTAIIFQHEIDHLDGILFIDKMVE